MGTTVRTARAVLLGLLATVLGACLLVPVGSAPASGAVARGTVTGEVLADGGVPLRVRWFDEDWNYVDQRKVTGRIYDLTLPAGTYYLQFVDLRPSYLVDKYAPTDIEVTVRKGRTVQKDVRMRVGAAITGTARGGGKALAGARIVAANAHEQSFETKADRKGRFAIGGLPDGSYSVFTYDRKAQWVGRSTYLRGLRARQVRDTAIALGTRAGSLRVELRAGRDKMRQTAFVTAVSKASGQFWTVKASRGVAVFDGLFPGGYRMVAPAVGSYLPEQGSIDGAKVRPGRADLVSTFTWTKQAARVTGTVVDGRYPDFEMSGVRVELLGAEGGVLASTTSGGDGRFWMNAGTATLKGVSIRISAAGGSAPYMQGKNWCKFGSSRTSSFSVGQYDELDVAELALPHLPTAEQDNQSTCGS